jgi:long-chain acyl-CoA synthetase
MTRITLSRLLDDAAARWPDRPALFVEEGHHSAAPHPHERREKGEHLVTYAELRDYVLRAASLLRSEGIRKGDCVAILHRNGLGFVVSYFALARLGAVAAPINFMVQKAEELHYMLKDCSAKGIVTQRAFLREVHHAQEGLPGCARVWISDGKAHGSEDFWDLVRSQPPYGGPDGASPGDPASILYTSGTTGEPKGVLLSHSNLASNAAASAGFFDLSFEDSFLCLLPMFHTFAWTCCVLIPLLRGASIIVVSSITPPKPWLLRMGRHRASVFAAVPQIYSVLARQARGLARLFLRWWCLRGVRYCISGAAPLSPQIAREFKSALGRDILEGYGLTETSPVATINPPGRHKPGSAGVPIPGVSLRVVDEDGRELPRGSEGEVCIRGHNVMLGYHGRPLDTREILDSEGWLRTGDIGLVDPDGFLHIRDRKKDMIIVKGLKVFPAQVEAELLRHPGVAEAAVVGIPEDTGDEIIKAFVVPKPGASLDRSDLMHLCRHRLDAYKRPRDIEVVSELPKNSIQKVLKRILRQRELEKKGAAR